MASENFKILVLDGDAPQSALLWAGPLPERVLSAKQHSTQRVDTWMSNTRYDQWPRLLPEFTMQPRDVAIPNPGDGAVDILGAVIEASAIDRPPERARRRLEFQKLCFALASTKGARYRTLGFLTLVAGPEALTPEISAFAEQLSDDARAILFANGAADPLLKVEGVINESELNVYIADFVMTATKRKRLAPDGS